MGRNVKTPQLLEHGERVRAVYEPQPGEKEGPAGLSTTAERPGGEITGVIKRYEKSDRTPYRPQALGWIKAVYGDAIEYTSVTKELKGLAFFWALVYGLGIGGVGLWCGSQAIGWARWEDWYDVFSLVVGVGMITGGMLFGIFFFSFFMRAELFRPADMPVIFDRKHRKVYRLFRDEQSGWRGVLKPWPLLACEYDWDLIDAEHHGDLYTTGGTISRNHFLMFLVRKAPDDPNIIDSFQIASANVLSKELTDAVWEHIRRFMEENGPHLPAPDEPLASMEAPTNWWQSLGAVGPFGPNYFHFWRDSPGITLLHHLLFPLFGPMLFIWGTGNWLSYKTAIPVAWPQKVLAAIGPRTR